ncbi:septum site-determining protein MinC [Salirhabdus euzebyi]|uniref:Probable septum site-determining protein MinC n=1 Tax=Salirhabdus euzebyi TaxID=394506 RepID=A0A841Q2Y4_9BACI|nr:septum site-determining protein MinC [Salirhabdus euzebyi]MBB6451918.1 septum site-determining protein MinC [Salirhabdus euzebyi]
MNNKKQAVTIKGTKEGLTFIIDESCSFDHVLIELEQKLSSSLVEKEHPMIKVNVYVGNRYVSQEMKDQIINIVRSKKNLIINDVISDVMTKKEARKIQQDLDVTTITRMIRSGQVIHVKGDLLLIGDVNPGGRITATGNIYVLGKLTGIAHAGVEGNRQAVIAAAYMNPTQLRIADFMSRAPDFETEGLFMECAYIDNKEEKIIIDRLQRLSNIRPNMNSIERRMSNG